MIVQLRLGGSVGYGVIILMLWSTTGFISAENQVVENVVNHRDWPLTFNCSTTVQRVPLGQDAQGLNVAGCWAYFLFSLLSTSSH